ncbi:class I SAM-dependent methyltransferase [Kitasatospora kazusensis]|uniref:Class I SAM-dependent methyltransferase n=1 Tax=Kitasatospora kazusensis TaxID=407974 RepID=A0ABN2ZJU0_9ACTN
MPGGLFGSTVPYYARFRPGYDHRLSGLLRERFGLDGTQRVLDLGAGSGALTLPLARMVREVVAVDPEPAMLAEGRRLAARAGLTGIDWRLGDSGALLALDVGPVLLAAMGASFHWMERERPLRDLDTLVTAGGAVVLASCGARHDDLEPPPWQRVVDEVRERHLGPDRRPGAGLAAYPEVRHQDVLARSPFSRLEEAHWDGTVSRTVDQVIGLQLSFSFSSPAALGPDRPAFERDLRAALTGFQPDGRSGAASFDERVRTEVVIATRP